MRRAVPTCDQYVALVREIVNRRGYFVIGLLPGNENYYKRGQIIQQLADFRFVNQPWRVHQRTDYRDWQAQLELVREISPVPPRPSCSTIMRSSTFWKVITE